MLRRLGVAALVAGAVTLRPLGARAGDPPAGAAGAAAETGKSAAARGAVVIAVGDDAVAPARALALLVYRDAGLRPSIDDATARVLAGEAVPANASAGEVARLQELVQLRASLSGAGTGTGAATGTGTGTGAATGTGADTGTGAATGADTGTGAATGAATGTGTGTGTGAAAGASANDAVDRRILAGIGAEAKATHLVVVRVRDGRAAARVLRVGSASWQAVEIGATVQTDVSGTTYSWPGALEVLRGIIVAPSTAQPKAAKAAMAPTRAALTPAASGKAGADAGKSGGFWSSPWFWLVLGGVVAAGATTFYLAGQAGSDDPGVTRVQGTVPR